MYCKPGLFPETTLLRTSADFQQLANFQLALLKNDFVESKQTGLVKVAKDLFKEEKKHSMKHHNFDSALTNRPLPVTVMLHKKVAPILHGNNCTASRSMHLPSLHLPAVCRASEGIADRSSHPVYRGMPWSKTEDRKAYEVQRASDMDLGPTQPGARAQAV